MSVIVVLSAVATGAICVRHGIRGLRHRYGRPPRRSAGSAVPPARASDVTLAGPKGTCIRGWLLTPPDLDACPSALLIHGWGSCAADMLPLAVPLCEEGFRVLLIDARCHGRSDDGEVASMPSFAEDIESGLAWLRQQDGVDPDRIVLIGHSVGAGACLRVASSDPGIAAVVSIASMAHPRQLMSNVLGRRLPSPIAKVALRLTEHAIGHRFDTFAPVHTIGRVGVPTLILHGEKDRTVPLEDAYTLLHAARGPATLVVVPDAGHTDPDALVVVLPQILDLMRTATAHPG